MSITVRDRAIELEVKLTRGQQKEATQRAAKFYADKHGKPPDQYGGQYTYNAGHLDDMKLVDAAILTEIACSGTPQQKSRWSVLEKDGLV
jgi:hypothetical protein